MAHEALKFNVEVNNFDKWQPIYGGQDHGTFYMIYMKISEVVEQDNKFHYYAEFKLQNFVGAVSIGFGGHRTPELIELTNEAKNHRNKQLIEIMKGEGISDSKEQSRLLEEHRVDFRLNLQVTPFDNDFHIPKTKLQGMSNNLVGNILETDCLRNSPPSELYDQKDPQKSKYINPYHYQRAGDETHVVGLRNLNSSDPFTHVGQAGTWLIKCNPTRSFLI